MFSPAKLIWLFLIFMLMPGLFSEELNYLEMIDFFNTQIPEIMEEHNLVGVVFSLVNKDRILFSKGYGYSDIENQVKVDPDRTLFRVASISKLFTWTAIMQLTEQGKIDINENVNTYLGDIKIPDIFAKPITIRNILTHTPGFEDNILSLSAKDETEIKSLKKVIIQNMVKRIRPPGEEICYSNYGACLAGYIIENVTGIPFEKYIEENILKPLNMSSSTFYQPVPERLIDTLSKGYAIKNKIPVEKSYEYVQGAPAAGLSTTARDMARFLIFHLNQGSHKKGILKSETIKKMHTTLFRPDPKSGGFAHGLIDSKRNELRILWHGGNLLYFHSYFIFCPEKNWGIFLSTNTGTGMVALHYLYEDFMNRFFPASPGKEIAIRNTRPLEEYTGSFGANRRSVSDFSKLYSIFLKIDVKLSKDKKGLDFLKKVCIF